MLPAQSESDVFHVTSAGNVTVGLGSVMMLPSGFTGVQFVVSDISLFFSTVCDRTTQVANAIVAAVSAATPCDEITTAQLAEITTLNLSSTGISSLQIGDFAGLTKLMSLDLSSNDLSELPANIFAGLINLEILRLNNNNLVTLPANIFADLTSLQTLLLNNNNLVTLPTNIFADLTSLQTLLLNNNDLVALPPNIFAGLISLQNFSIDNNPDDDEFRLELILNRTVVPDEAVSPANLVLELVEGAPTMISAQILVDGSAVPPSGAITVTNPDGSPAGAITVTNPDGSPATELILLVGATVSNTIRVANTGPDKVTVTIGTLTTPTSTGIEFVRNALELFPTPVCERTQAVADAIVEASTADSCDEVTTTQLAGIETLDLSGDDSSSEITSLMSGDFDGLAGLTELDLSDNSLTTLPETIFNSLTALSNLDLSANAFSTLPPNIFAGLTNLLTLNLASNGLNDLPEDIFNGLTALSNLDLSSNAFSTLPANIFADLTDLLTLDLSSNAFSTLLANIFAGLINLETLRLNDNDLETPPMNIFASLTNLLTLDLSSNDFSTLPPNIFAGLTNLKTLNMVNNPDTGDNYMFNLSLSRVNVANYAPSPAFLSLQIAEGAPTALTFPIIVVTGTATITDDAGNDIDDELTLAAGSIESDMFRVISTDVVAVRLGMAIFPTGFTGVQFDVSDVLFLFSTVCGRTPQVADAIVAAVLVETCDEVAAAHLASITTLDLSGISSLQTGDFDGLTNLVSLDLSSGGLSELPENIFAGLTNLVTLDLSSDLSSGGLSELPANIFADLTNLETLLLNDNDLVTLPPNIFAGLTRLNMLNLSGNPDAGDSYTFTLDLTRTDGFNDDAPSPAMVSLRLNEGAPTKLSFLLATDNITISNTEVMTINAGSTESNTVRIERTGGAGKIMLAISEVVLGLPLPPQFIGMDLNTDDVLPLFPIPTVPMAPTIVVNSGNGQLTVSWNVPDDGNSPIKSFTVFVSRPGEDPSSTMVGASMSTHTIMRSE